MSVKTMVGGKRQVSVEVEVPGTPDQVWQAIASGPGVSSWFVPTTFDEHDGTPTALTSTFGPGMGVRATITDWHPPRMFVARSEGFEGAPPMATEWHVEAQAGGTCIVRVVHSLFADSDEWDEQICAAEHGWPGFFRALRIYLEHFAGMRSAIMQIVMPVAGTDEQAWDALTSAIGVAGTHVGQHWTAPSGAPALGGVVEYIARTPFDALMRLDVPGPGLGALGAFSMGDGKAMVAFNIYFYGDEAEAHVARETPAWRAWMESRFGEGRSTD